jgi:hypothetical protein
MWLNARNVEDETSSVFARKHPRRWKGRVSSFPTRYPEPSESNHEAARTPDLESRSPTLFLGRAWLTEKGSIQRRLGKFALCERFRSRRL